MDKNTVVELFGKGEVHDALSSFLREKAVTMLQLAVEAEVETFVESHAHLRTEAGQARVVRNGYLPEREILTGLGAVGVKVPRVRDRGEDGIAFRSSLVPAYVRRAKSIDALLPWLYLKGIAAGQMQSALEALLGPQAKGLSANVVGRLKAVWGKEYEAWAKADLSKDEWVYVWADGVYSGLRAEDHRLCVLIVVGVNARGQKRFLAIEEGMRESAESWRGVLRGLKARGLKRPPKLAVGDGALGFWRALEELYPQTKDQRCWVHKSANVLNYLPKSLQAKARGELHDIWMAPTRDQAHKAFDRFVQTYQAKYPKAAQCLSKDKTALLAFYDFPAEHWSHVRTTNPIESTFASIRHRTDRTKGAVTRVTMLALIYKLAMCAQESFRKLNGFHHLAEVIRGVKFVNGVSEAQAPSMQKVAA